MAGELALPEEAIGKLNAIGRADIVVGIPSFRNVQTIGRVVEVAGHGLALHFPKLRGVVINSDGGSDDGTQEAALRASVPPGIGHLVTTYLGLPGKGSALRAIFQAAQVLEAQACVVVDSDLRSITPEWIGKLAGPVVEGEADYLVPLYRRHKYDGTITNNIAYPMTRALYGLDVRQPIGGDFGLSGSLISRYLEADVWESDVARFGIDIWMTTTAIAEVFRVAQAPLGLKIHDAKDPAQSLGPMFAQVVGTLFGLMKTYESRWRTVTEVRSGPIWGALAENSEQPEEVPVNLEAMLERFREGFSSYGRMWEEVLCDESRKALKEILSLPALEFRFPSSTWAAIAFDFAVAYNSGKIAPTRVVEAMVPLYLGRTAGLVREVEGINSEEAETVIRAQAEAFWEQRGFLMERWDAARGLA